MNTGTVGFALGIGLSCAVTACAASPGPPAAKPRPPAATSPASAADAGAPEAPEPCSAERERRRSANALATATELTPVDIRATDPSVISDGLRLVLRECETCCNDGARALLWLKLGTFLAAVGGDAEGAGEAFDRALSLEAGVDLDAKATPERVQRSFAEARRRRGVAAPSR